jgi:hypothetical protein
MNQKLESTIKVVVPASLLIGGAIAELAFLPALAVTTAAAVVYLKFKTKTQKEEALINQYFDENPGTRDEIIMKQSRANEIVKDAKIFARFMSASIECSERLECIMKHKAKVV